MAWFRPRDRDFLKAVQRMAYANPFLPDRVDAEKEVLGDDFVAGEPVWSASVSDPEAVRPNVRRIKKRLRPLLDELRPRIAEASPDEMELYESGVHHHLYQQYYDDFVSAQNRWPFYKDFEADWDRYLNMPGARFETSGQAAHFFACFWQVQRAFHSIFDNIIGSSIPSAWLRASVWQSIFTHDLRRYRRGLYRRMGDFPTLITGPSGTGKELVARAIAGSRYIGFEAGRLQFASSPKEFYPVNLAALPATLIESELFGHRKGSFTGATSDRRGWLESCPPQGTVFLDEIGELDPSIQVKLLRVLETRHFSPVGGTEQIRFEGKIIAATNRDLAAEIRAGRFREDLYYRLCADQIVTPSLKEQIQDSPTVFHELLHYMVRRTLGPTSDAELELSLAEVENWIQAELPRHYSWPGNYRELEQCIRNILIRQSYRPLEARPADADSGFWADFRQGNLTADDVIAQYAAHVYGQCGSYVETARRLGLDRRTVKAKVELHLRGATP